MHAVVAVAADREHREIEGPERRADLAERRRVAGVAGKEHALRAARQHPRGPQPEVLIVQSAPGPVLRRGARERESAELRASHQSSSIDVARRRDRRASAFMPSGTKKPGDACGRAAGRCARRGGRSGRARSPRRRSAAGPRRRAPAARGDAVAKRTGLARSPQIGSVRMLTPSIWIRNVACPTHVTVCLLTVGSQCRAVVATRRVGTAPRSGSWVKAPPQQAQRSADHRVVVAGVEVVKATSEVMAGEVDARIGPRGRRGDQRGHQHGSEPRPRETRRPMPHVTLSRYHGRRRAGGGRERLRSPGCTPLAGSPSRGRRSRRRTGAPRRGRATGSRWPGRHRR